MYYINRCFVLNPNSKYYEVPEETSGLGLLNNGLNIASNEIPRSLCEICVKVYACTGSLGLSRYLSMCYSPGICLQWAARRYAAWLP